MSCESYDLRLTTLSPIHIGSGKSYSCCEFVPAKAKSKGQIVKIIKRVNLTNYYSSLSDDRKDTFLASLTNSNFELKQFDKKIKKDFVRYQCIDNSRVDFINEVQEHIKTSDKLYIPGSSIKGAIRTAIFYDLLTEEDMDKIGRDISSNRRNNSFLSNDLLKKHFTSGFGNDAQYNIFRFMQVADTTTTNLPRIEQVLAVMATDDRRKNQFYSKHGKVVKSYLETIGANKNLEKTLITIFNSWFINFENYDNSKGMKIDDSYGEIPVDWSVEMLEDYVDFVTGVEPGSKNYHEKPEPNDIPFLRVGDLGSRDNGVFIDPSLSKNKILKYDDIVLSLDATIGIVKMGLEGAYSTGMRKLVIKNDNINQPFLYCLVKSNRIQKIIETFATGTTILHAGKSIKHMNFVLSDKKTMDDFDKIGNPIISIILTNLKEIEYLTNLRDTLLPKLMSGEIDVSKINCDLELKYNYMKYLFNQIHKQLSKSVV